MLHVAGTPIAGAAAAVRRLRDDGHRIRFVTNSTTRSRAQVVEQMREMAIDLDESELQTTGSVASRVLHGRRVLALTMPGILDDLEGLQLAAVEPQVERVVDVIERFAIAKARVEVLRAPRIAGGGRGRRARENQCIHGVISMPS